MRRFLVRAGLALFVLMLVVVGGAAAYVWHLGNDAMTRATKSGWFERAGPNELATPFEQTMQTAFFDEIWDKRSLPCSLISGVWREGTGSSSRAETVWTISMTLANDINWEEFVHSYSLESQLRRWSLACHLQGRFSDTQIMRIHLQRSRFGGEAGADEVALALFGKPAGRLDFEESVRLAAIYHTPDMRGKPDEWNRRAEHVRELINR
ncbi:MAG TPA: transglycosylase domain-containing protein [Hyphomonadaceae bacterium]|jgi:hypothetical protein|nr:transglycosylase domain-containing protein [Hyphomonadaceae bacterium]